MDSDRKQGVSTVCNMALERQKAKRPYMVVSLFEILCAIKRDDVRRYKPILYIQRYAAVLIVDDGVLFECE